MVNNDEIRKALIAYATKTHGKYSEEDMDEFICCEKHVHCHLP